MSKKTKKFLLIIYVVSLFIMLIGATYAYFTVIKVSTVLPEATVTSATTEVLYFNVGDDLFIYANDNNFKNGENSLVSNTYAKAKLVKGDATVSMKHKYNLKLEIDTNNLVYTVSEDIPELLLKVSGPNGEITSIEGLSYKTVVDNKNNSISGFDITTKTGTFFIAKDFVIETDSEIEQDWDISVYLVNLDASQNENKDREFLANVVIEKVI